MEKERKNGSSGRRRKGKRNKTPSYYYRRALRVLKKRKRTVLAAGICALAACCMILVIWALVQALSGKGAEAEMEAVENVAGEPIDVMEPLLENAYSEVNDLINRYFAALQEGDEETLTALRDNTGTAELLRMQENSSHIEAYTDISELPKHIFDEIRHFFTVYKDLEGKKTAVNEFEGALGAVRVIEECIERYKEKYGEKHSE